MVLDGCGPSAYRLTVVVGLNFLAVIPIFVTGSGALGRWLQRELPQFQAQTAVKVAVEIMPCRRFGPWRLKPHHFNDARQLSQFQYLTLDTTHVGTLGGGFAGVLPADQAQRGPHSPVQLQRARAPFIT